MDSIKKFVVRVLDADDVLLAWAEIYAEPRPQARGASCPFWPTGPTELVITRAGSASRISVHWCDLDVARVQNLLAPTEVKVGQRFTLTWMEPIWLVSGMRDVPLPGVTVQQSVTLGVPAGDMAAVSH